MDKKSRQRIIRDVISKEAIQSQEELQARVASFGVAATQATLSRDLKELGVTKQHLPGTGYKYVLNKSVNNGGTGGVSGVVSIEFLGTQAVIRTIPGYAGAVASQIDAAALREVAGTIAGDDTVLLMLRPSYKKAGVLHSLASVIPDIEVKVLE